VSEPPRRYSWEDYVYPAAPGQPDVLRNHLGLTDLAQWHVAERVLTHGRYAELVGNPELVPQTFDVAHWKSIHHHLFQDMYAWAGNQELLRQVHHSCVERAGCPARSWPNGSRRRGPRPAGHNSDGRQVSRHENGRISPSVEARRTVQALLVQAVQPVAQITRRRAAQQEAGDAQPRAAAAMERAAVTVEAAPMRSRRPVGWGFDKTGGGPARGGSGGADWR
jgi:hypothetical protein